jgi:hypothetical protein
MSSEAAGDDENLEPPFILMRAEETFDGQERVMSRSAYDLQVAPQVIPRPAATLGMCPTITSSTWTASASRP